MERQLRIDIQGIDASPDYFPARVELEVKHANERAKQLYDACCDIWDKQGRRKYHPFFRAILYYCLIPFFDGRVYAVGEDFALLERAMVAFGSAQPGVSAVALKSFARAIGDLRETWNTRLTIESRDAATIEQTEREGQTGHAIVTPALLTTSAIAAGSDATTGSQRQRRAPARMDRTKRPKLSELEAKKQQTIYGALQAGLDYSAYCKALDDRKVQLPIPWQSNNGPKTYSEAYKGNPLRRKIQKERYRFNRKFKAEPLAERERIIQSVLRTQT